MYQKKPKTVIDQIKKQLLKIIIKYIFKLLLSYIILHNLKYFSINVNENRTCTSV